MWERAEAETARTTKQTRPEKAIMAGTVQYLATC